MIIPEEKAILACNEGTIQLLCMYTGNTLNSFHLQSYNEIEHTIGPLCAFYGMRSMLIDVRTGEIVRKLGWDTLMRSCTHSVLIPNIVDLHRLHGGTPSRSAYLRDSSNALVCEYAQI
jgi:hypothetical protein